MPTIKINYEELEYDNIIYVDAENGSDSDGDGSEDNPYASFQKAFDNINDNDCIKLLNGTFDVEGETFHNKDFDIIGNEKDTILDWKSNDPGSYIFDGKVNIYNLIIKGTNEDRVISNNDGQVKLYNCAYDTKFRFQGTSSKEFTLENCSVATEPYGEDSGGDLYIKNTALVFDITDWSNLEEFETSLTNVEFDDDYNITSDDDWEHEGTGENPDGTQAHIGVYGGKYAWGNWKTDDNNDLSGNIEVILPHDDLNSNIFIPYEDKNDLSGNIIIRQDNYNDLNSNIEVIISDENDLNSTLEIAEHNNLPSKISISYKNEMEAQFEVWEINNEDLQSTIRVKEFLDRFSKLTVRRSNDSQIDSNIFVYLLAENDLNSNLSVCKPADLNCSIKINWNNHMEAMYEIIPPPTEVEQLTPIQDAFIRENMPKLNYGTEEDMLAGYSVDKNEIYRSLVKFDINEISDINVNDIKRVTLKLYAIHSTDSDKDELNEQNVEIVQVDGNWKETGVTWDNQPRKGRKITDNKVDKKGYIEFDVKDLFIDWYEGNEYNDGFYVLAKDETTEDYKRFKTRESNYPPILEVEYYSQEVYSSERNNLDSNIFVVQLDNNDLNSTIEIESSWRDFDLPSKIKFSYQLEGNITVTRPDLNSNILVYQLDDSEINGSITVRITNVNDLNSTIVVNKYFVESNIYVLYRDNLESSIIVRQSDNSDLNSNIKTNRPELISNIYVLYRDNLDSNIIIQQTDNNNLDSNIRVNRDEINCNIYVLYHDDLNSNINVIKTNVLNSSIIIRQSDNSDLNGHLWTILHNDLSSHIQCNSPYLASHIKVVQHNKEDLFSKITVVRYNNEDLDGTITIVGYALSSSIYILYRNNINSRINVKQVNDLPSKISTVYKDDLETTITIRVKWVNDLNSYINIMSLRNKVRAFIM